MVTAALFLSSAPKDLILIFLFGRAQSLLVEKVVCAYFVQLCKKRVSAEHPFFLMRCYFFSSSGLCNGERDFECKHYAMVSYFMWLGGS